MIDEELRPFRVRGRWLSLLVLVLGGHELYRFDQLIRISERVPRKLQSIGAVLVAFGLVGLVEPLIFYPRAPDGKRFHRSALLAALLFFVLTFVVGYAVGQHYGLD